MRVLIHYVELPLVLFLWSKKHLFNFNFSFGNREKSHGAKSGEYGGWFNTQTFVLPKSSWRMVRIVSLLMFKGQHQCNSIDFWTFFLGWSKGSKKKRFEDVFGHVFKFSGKFCHWQISQNGGTGAILRQRVFYGTH